MAIKGISSLELRRWVNKHKAIIETSRINQTYRLESNEVCFAIHTKESKKFIVVKMPNLIALTDTKPDKDAKETGFGSWLRNNLCGAIIKKVEQIDSERILHFKLQKAEDMDLYIEFFGKGNIIICQNNKVLISLEKQELKDRLIAKGEEYNPPKGFNTFEANEDEITFHIQNSIQNNITNAAKELVKEEQVKEAIENPKGANNKKEKSGPEKTSQLNASKFFATKLGLGGEFSKELCEIIGVDINADLSVLDAKDIKRGLAELVAKEVDFKYLEDRYYEETPKENIFDKRKQKIDAIIEEQKKTLEKTGKDIIEMNARGEFIYQNFLFFDELKKAYDYAEEHKKDFSIALAKLIEKHNFKDKIVYKKPHIEVETNEL